MAYSEIDIAPGATNRANYTGLGGYTAICVDNTANATGVLNSFEIWMNTNGSNVKMGTFSKSGSDFTPRDYESIGSVTSGAKRTYTGKNCSVNSGDYLGVYGTSGNIECDTSGGGGVYWYPGDGFTRKKTYSLASGQVDSIYATGVTIPDAPTNVSATDDLTDKVTITWTAGTGETGGHRVYRDGDDISGVVANGTATYDDTTAVAGTTYSYTVKAINDAGLSDASSADNGTRLLGFTPRAVIF